MANIAFGNLTAHEGFGNYTLGSDWIGDKNNNGQADSDEIVANPLGQNAIVYKMLQYGKSKRVTSITAPALEHFDLIYWSQKDRSTVVTTSGTVGYHTLVTVWKVKR